MLKSKIGFLFPGQGAQYVGMGKDLYERFPTAKKIYDQADARLQFALSKICFEGPENELTRTLIAQPAIFVTSIAALEVLKEKYPDIKPSFAAGLSLGEFTALVAVGSMSFAQGLSLVQKRADAMEQSARKNPGTMASIIGLSAAECEAIAKAAGCEIANLNAPDQIVLTGTFETIEKACQDAETKGAKKAIRLKVGGAFHSSLMRDAQANLEKALKETVIKIPNCTFIPNTTAQSQSDPKIIAELLARQLTSSVRWVETMQRAKEEGMQVLLEIGPGKVLKGLARRCEKELIVEVCGTAEDIENLEKNVVGA